MTDPLVGCRVLITRERPGELAEMLTAAGAHVVHVPLIKVVEADDGVAEGELTRLGDYDWLMVTSSPGAERVGPTARRASIRLAAVGSATATTLARLAGRPVDLVPTKQHAGALLEAFESSVSTPQRVLVAQADRAADTLVDGLRRQGHDVTAVVAYRTELQEAPPGVLDDVDVLVLASGSAAQAWADTVGEDTPPIVVSIGPTTTAVAQRLGLKITATAADHSLDGLMTELRLTIGSAT